MGEKNYRIERCKKEGAVEKGVRRDINKSKRAGNTKRDSYLVPLW